MDTPTTGFTHSYLKFCHNILMDLIHGVPITVYHRATSICRYHQPREDLSKGELFSWYPENLMARLLFSFRARPSVVVCYVESPYKPSWYFYWYPMHTSFAQPFTDSIDALGLGHMQIIALLQILVFIQL